MPGDGCSLDCQIERVLISGKKLLLKHKDGDKPKHAIILQSLDTAIVPAEPGAAGDPTLGGGELRIVNLTTLEEERISFPAENWRGLGKPAGAKGYKYLDKTLASGPCKLVLVKAGSLKVVCKGNQIGFTLNEPLQGSLVATLGLGSDPLFCMQFGGTIKEKPAQNGKQGQFNARSAPVPAACPVP